MVYENLLMKGFWIKLLLTMFLRKYVDKGGRQQCLLHGRRTAWWGMDVSVGIGYKSVSLSAGIQAPLVQYMMQRCIQIVLHKKYAVWSVQDCLISDGMIWEVHTVHFCWRAILAPRQYQSWWAMQRNWSR